MHFVSNHWKVIHSFVHTELWKSELLQRNVPFISCEKLCINCINSGLYSSGFILGLVQFSHVSSRGQEWIALSVNSSCRPTLLPELWYNEWCNFRQHLTLLRLRKQTLMCLHNLFLTPPQLHLYNTVCFLGYFSSQLQKQGITAGKSSLKMVVHSDAEGEPLREHLSLLSLLKGSLNCFKRTVHSSSF